MQFDVGDPLLDELREAGYHIEPYKGNPEATMVVELPTKGAQVPTESEVSIEQKLEVALAAQEYWADNSVSFTLTFHPHEQDKLRDLLKQNWGRYKSLTCMPIYEAGSGAGREMQLPYESILNSEYGRQASKLLPLDMDRIYDGGEALAQVGDKYCETDHCVI